MSTADEAPTSNKSLSSSLTSDRNRRQAGLFFGGAAFVLFSAIVTRRAVARRNYTSQLSSFSPPGTLASGTKGSPPSAAATGYIPAAAAAEGAAAASSNATTSAAAELNNSGPILAVEALFLATINTFSWALATTGGALWYFDISSMDELRRKVRGGLGVDGTGRTEQEAEEEMEEWLATVLARKEEKQRAKEGQEREWKNERGSRR